VPYIARKEKALMKSRTFSQNQDEPFMDGLLDSKIKALKEKTALNNLGVPQH